MKIELTSEYDHKYTHEPVCPHCGYVHRDSWEWHGDDGEYDCGSCEKPFSYSRQVSITYSTSKIESLDLDSEPAS